MFVITHNHMYYHIHEEASKPNFKGSVSFLTHCILGNFQTFLSSADFFSKLTF